jgi:mono/diheme cytochrome c family protein
MYRGIIEQYNFISSYLKEQTLRRRLHDAIQGKGRLWRVTYAAGPRDPTRPDLASADPGRLARLLDHPNGWWRDAAQQALVERGDRQAVPVLEQLAMAGEKEATRVAALWTLDGLGALNRAVAGRALHDRSGKVRAAAVRLHERWLAAEGAEKVVPTLAGLAADPDPAVAVQLALTLGEAKGAGAIDALYHVLDVAGAHPYIAKAIASGLSGREIDFIDFMIGRLDVRGSPTFREVLTVLSSAITREGNRERVARLIERLGETNRTPAWGRLALLDGIAVVIHASRKPTRAQGQIAAALAPLAAGSDSEFGRKAGDLIRQIKAREKEALASRTVTRELTAAERQLAEYGRGAFAVCAGCHQPGGTGLPGVAPSLVASPWVAGRPEALIRILLQGKEGTPGFAGGMPPASSLTNMQIAGLLTYIRNSWGLQAGAIDASLVAQVRDKTASRLTPWTAAELEHVK